MCCNRARPRRASPLPSSGASVARPGVAIKPTGPGPHGLPQSRSRRHPPDQPGMTMQPLGTQARGGFTGAGVTYMSRCHAYGALPLIPLRIPSGLARRTRPVWQYQTVPALSALLPALPGVSRIRLRSAPARLLRQPGEEVLHLLRFPAPHGAPAPRGALHGHEKVALAPTSEPEPVRVRVVTTRPSHSPPASYFEVCGTWSSVLGRRRGW